MKKALAIILLLTTLLLSACGSNSIPQLPSGGTEPQGTKVSETILAEQTMTPENTTEAANNSFSQPVTETSEATAPNTEKEEIPTSVVNATSPTEETTNQATAPSESQSEQSTITPTEGATDTLVQSEPTETQPSDPPQEETIATQPKTEPIDIASIESSAEAYAASLGFVVDNSLGKGTAGYYPPDYRPYSSMQDSISAAIGLVSATKNQLNSRFSDERYDVLVEGAYGLARVNCQVVYSHTDELGDWYYTYVFYG